MARSSAFISDAVSRLPARTLPWHAISEHTAAQRRRAALGQKPRNEFPHQPLYIGVAEKRRDLADRDGARAEGVEDEAQFGEFRRGVKEQGRLIGFKLDDFRNEEALAGDASVGQLGLHTLIDDALVGGVLVDDDHRRFGLGNDVGRMKLGARSAERVAAQFLRRLLMSGARIGARLGKRLEGRLHGLGEAGGPVGRRPLRC